MSDEGAHGGADHDIGEEMHTYNDARDCDQCGYRQKAGQTLGIEASYRNGYGERSHGVAGRKRKAIGRRDNRPTMRLNFTGPPPMAERLYALKDQDGHESRQSAGKESAVAVLPTANEYKNAQRIPKPAVAQPAHDQHE